MSEEFSPRIIGFLCHWCSYGGADLAGTKRIQMPPSLKIIRVMCSSRVDPVLVTTAFLRGADGVLIAGCHPGDCHYDRGNYFSRRRFAYTKKVIETLGLESERLKLSWISASEGQRFADIVSEFTQDVQKMGPNPVNGKTSL